MRFRPLSLRTRLLLLMLAPLLPLVAALAAIALHLPGGEAETWTLLTPVLPLAALSLALILILGWLMGPGLLLDALHPLISTVQRVAGGDLTARTPAHPSRDDEISRLMYEVDRMAEALARRDQALTEARDRAQAYLDVVGVMVLALNAKGNIALANRKACEVLGCREPANCVGGNWFDTFLPAADREAMKGIFTRILAGEIAPVEYFESTVLTIGGQHRLIAWHNTALLDASGRIIGALCAGQDITEMRRTEDALRESRNRYQNLVESLPGVVYRCAIAPPCTMQFINAQIEAITGIPVGRFLDQSVRYAELIHPDDLAAYQEVVTEGVAARRPYSSIYRLRGQGGVWRWVHERGQAVLDATGQPSWLDGVILDVTETRALQEEQEHLQAQLQQAQKMEALGQLTGGIAHDFNNILAAILGFTRLALRRHVPEPAGELAEYLREVIAAGERAGDLVTRMLTFSRAQPGRIGLPLSPGPLVKEMVKMLDATIPAGIRIDTRIGAETPDIAIDPVDLRQVLMNLVINARDSLEGKGGITISLHPAPVERGVCAACHEIFTGDFVRLTVADDGPGIAPDVLPHIFEPFYSTKPPGQGTGMGLSMVHGLVHRARGHIQVETHPDRGSTFHVYLPSDLPRVET